MNMSGYLPLGMHILGYIVANYVLRASEVLPLYKLSGYRINDIPQKNNFEYIYPKIDCIMYLCSAL